MFFLLMLACRAGDCEPRYRDCELTCAQRGEKYIAPWDAPKNAPICWCQDATDPRTVRAFDPLLPAKCATGGEEE